MKKLAIGCGIVVAVLAVIGIGVSVFLYNYVQDNLPDTRRLEELEERLATEFGEADGYVPPLDGRLDTDRVRLYVELRERSVGLSGAVVERVGQFTEGVLAQDDEGRSSWEGLKENLTTLREGFDLAEETVHFLTATDSLLVDARMGKGEYAYLNSLALFCWLEWDPRTVEAFQHPEDVKRLQETADRMEASLRALFLDQLDNQRHGLRALPSRGPQEEEMLALLEDEIPRRRADGHFPFRGALPAWQEEALRPYESRLQATVPHSFGAMMAESHSTLDIQASHGRIEIKSH